MSVVLIPPRSAQRLRIAHIQKGFRIQKLVTHTTIGALGESILPRTAWLDAQSLYISRAHTFLNFMRDELRSIVIPNVIRRTALLESCAINTARIRSKPPSFTLFLRNTESFALAQSMHAI